ncbi:MAG: Asp23/Gls24 family envelope stress response protein [Lachnospiraceae bacterium]|nr:Asp23/Gls24 family envelope stress response protein [Lachnospiraceae bacterium]
MKGSSMDTYLGNVIIDPNVVRQYAGTVANECFGIVGMANVNVQDGLVKLLKLTSANLCRGIKVNLLKDGRLGLVFHVVVSYGVSIRAVVDNLVNNVKYKVEEFTGLEIGKIDVYVEDVKVID